MMMTIIASARTFFMSSLIYKVANQMVKKTTLYVGWSFSKLKLELGYMHEAKSQQQNMSMSFSFAFFI